MVEVHNAEGHAMASYPSGIKAVRDESGVLMVYSDREKTKCIALHNAGFWAYVTVTDDE